MFFPMLVIASPDEGRLNLCNVLVLFTVFNTEIDLYLDFKVSLEAKLFWIE